MWIFSASNVEGNQTSREAIAQLQTRRAVARRRSCSEAGLTMWKAYVTDDGRRVRSPVGEVARARTTEYPGIQAPCESTDSTNDANCGFEGRAKDVGGALNPYGATAS